MKAYYRKIKALIALNALLEALAIVKQAEEIDENDSEV